MQNNHNAKKDIVHTPSMFILPRVYAQSTTIPLGIVYQ